MSNKKKERSMLLRKQEIAAGIFEMWVSAEKVAEQATAGQFVSLYCQDSGRLLPRPISICEIDKEEKSIRLVYRVVGEGTREFSRMYAGDWINIAGPLGNGFPYKEKKALLIGGGIGIPPMLELAKQLDCDKQIVLGYKDELFLARDFKEYGDVFIATEDGSAGTKGNVLDAITALGLGAEVIYACGPLPMLRAIKMYAKKIGAECYVSLEERMACGIGACLGCVCKSNNIDAHSNVKNKRICKEGPVFEAGEVDF